MNRLYLLAAGFAVLEFDSAAPERCLNRLTERRLPYWDVEQQGDFTLRLTVFYRDREAAMNTIRRAQGEPVLLRENAGLRAALGLLERPALLFSLLLSLLVTILAPKYVWFLTVEGNETIPEEQILQALDELGIRFGTRTSTIEIQTVKNHLLNLVDGLQWASVNCYGGRCEVLVRERRETPERLDRKLPCDVVAAKAGTIVELGVLEGQAQVSLYDTVTEGQTLVTGINDFVVNVQQTHAQAEIYALTWNGLRTATPDSFALRGNETGRRSTFYLQLGKFRIKIFGNSSISDSSCGKMINRKALTLPGGVTLPITLIRETAVTYETERSAMEKTDAKTMLLRFSRDWVRDGMVAGTILSEHTALFAQQGSYTIQADFACREMIAKEIRLFGSEQYGRTNSERRPDRAAHHGVRFLR